MPDNAQSYYAPPNGINSKEYVLYMEHPNPLVVPYPLLSHTLGSVAQTLTDVLMFNRMEMRNGRLVTKARIARPAEETNRDYTLGFPFGAIHTPALEAARAGFCETNFYMKYLCPSNVCFEHFYVFTDAQMDAPVEAEELITVDDVVEIFETTTLHVIERLLYVHLEGEITYTATLGAGAGTLDAIHAVATECEGCGNCANTIYIGGNDGAGAAETAFLMRSLDRGVTFTEIDLDTLTGGDTGSLFITDIKSIGDYIFVTLTDDLAAATATAGAVAYSLDGGTTWTVPAAITTALYTAFVMNDIPHVAGDGGELWRAPDGVNWEQVVHAITTETIQGSDVDREEGVAYLGATAGDFVVYDGTSITDATTPLGLLSPTDLFSVRVLGHNRIQVGGLTGFAAETRDGAEVWTLLNVLGTTDTVFSLAGDHFRALAGAGDQLYERDILGDLKYAVVPYKYGANPSGNVTAISQGEDQNTFFLVYSTGEVMRVVGCQPDLCADRAEA